MEPNLALVKRIKELMKQDHMKMYGLATRSGISHSTLSNILKGSTLSPGYLTLVNLCRGFDMPLNEFFDSTLFDFENLSDD